MKKIVTRAGNFLDLLARRAGTVLHFVSIADYYSEECNLRQNLGNSVASSSITEHLLKTPANDVQVKRVTSSLLACGDMFPFNKPALTSMSQACWKACRSVAVRQLASVRRALRNWLSSHVCRARDSSQLASGAFNEPGAVLLLRQSRARFQLNTKACRKQARVNVLPKVCVYPEDRILNV